MTAHSTAHPATGGKPVAGPGPDRWLAPDLNAAEDLVRSGVLLDAVDPAVGGLV